MAKRLPRAFYERDTVTVARELLGKTICVSGGVRARIVETEAYHGEADRASHASRGRTKRTAVMFGPPGHAYVYLIYGMWDCLNVVTMEEGFPAAVLIRAAHVEAVDDLREGAGPGKLCRALGIDRALDGVDVVRGEALWIEDSAAAARKIRRGPRINVDYAGPKWAARPWRFWLDGDPSVSK
jgi:DNA-3-methyladenine glycosylase